MLSSSENVEVTVFDQGRRGPGGRASHRAVRGSVVVPDDLPVEQDALHFDHGCQFFRADCAPMQELVRTWVAKGLAAEWKGKFGHVGGEVSFGPLRALREVGGNMRNWN